MVETLRDGRFVVLGLIGRGANGETFDGIDKREGRPVAIKRFDVRGARSWKDVELAEREARVLQALSHPKLPRYVDHFESEGALYLVMEKIEGEALASLRARGGPMGEADVVRFLTDAADVLDYLHRRSPPVIHRDLKPGNVIRRPDGSFAFVDFGSVRDQLRPRGGSTVVGTFGYMAPEQFQGRALPASDVYAAGATALAMLTGREPEDLPHRGLAIDVRSALGGLARPPLIRILERMLAPDPEQRAARIAPLLTELRAGRVDFRSDALPWGSEPWIQAAASARPAFEAALGSRHLQRAMKKVERKAERYARREARRQARRLARGEWQPSSRPLPRPVAVALALAFAVAMLAVAVTTQLFVPIALQVLALFVARRALTGAARNVREAGRVALDSIARGQRLLLGEGEKGGGVERPARVRDPSEGPVRVGTPEPVRPRVEDADLTQDEQDQPPGRQGRQG